MEHAPETLFVEVPAFADFMLRRVVLRPERLGVGAEERQRRVVRVGAGGVERVDEAIPNRGVLGEGKQVAVIVEIDAAPVEINGEPDGPVGAGRRIHGRGLEPGREFHGNQHTSEAHMESTRTRDGPSLGN